MERAKMRVGVRAAGVIAATGMLVAMMAVPAAAAPAVTGYFPTTAIVGCYVTLQGSGFAGASTVGFPGTATTSPGIVDSTTRLVAPVAAGATGTGALTVTQAPDPVVTGPATFTVATTGTCPTVTTLSSFTGPVGSVVTITGANFVTGFMFVRFGSSADVPATVLSPNQLTVTVPSGVTGAVPVRVTNIAVGAAANAPFFTVTGTSVPTISGFSPLSGPTGTSVTINGTNLTGATSVTFNNVAAAAGWIVNGTGTQITGAIVPATATDGPIRVTTPGGTAVSPTNFDVTGVAGAEHPRTVSLSLSGRLKVTGTVDATDGYTQCEGNIGVKIQKQKSGGWKTLTNLHTNDNGSYKGWVPNASGKYRAKVGNVTLLNGATCGSDASPSRNYNA